LAYFRGVARGGVIHRNIAAQQELLMKKVRTEQTPSPARILRDAEVGRLTGLSRTTRWRRVRDGDFPMPLQLGDGSRAVGWYAADIERWLASLKPAAAFVNAVKVDADETRRKENPFNRAQECPQP
jgi:prophage regulatory protein